MSEATTVLVTGLSGYIASHIAATLVARGYHVRGTVRSKAPEKTQHLCHGPLAAVELFEADLLTAGSFDAAAAGASVVFHTASPVVWRVEDAERDMVRPAVEGTLNVLRACRTSGTVRAVVLTSSMAAVYSSAHGPDHVFSPLDWNTTSTLDDAPYRVSKVKAERAAWAFVEEECSGPQQLPLRMATVCPSVVLGPQLSDRHDSLSLGWFADLFRPASAVDDAAFNPFAVGASVCEVRDVARLHVLLGERLLADSHATPPPPPPTPSNGRYLCASERRYTGADVVAALRSRLGSEAVVVPAFRESLHGVPASPTVVVDTSRTLEFFRAAGAPPLAAAGDMFEDALREVIRCGMVAPPPCPRVSFPCTRDSLPATHWALSAAAPEFTIATVSVASLPLTTLFTFALNPTDSRGYRALVFQCDSSGAPLVRSSCASGDELVALHEALAAVSHIFGALGGVVAQVQVAGNNGHALSADGSQLLVGVAGEEPFFLHGHVIARGNPLSCPVATVPLGGPAVGEQFDMRQRKQPWLQPQSRDAVVARLRELCRADGNGRCTRGSVAFQVPQ